MSDRRRLHNEDWGYESNCFVCEPKNAAGLQVPFFHDSGSDRVVADINLSNDFSGAPTFLHGGVTLALLDEAMAWACIALGNRWAVTTETSTRFSRPVLVDTPYAIEAEIISQDDEAIETAAKVLDADGKVCAEATATFTILGEAQLQRIVGSDDPIDGSMLTPGEASTALREN